MPKSSEFHIEKIGNLKQIKILSPWGAMASGTKDTFTKFFCICNFYIFGEHMAISHRIFKCDSLKFSEESGGYDGDTFR